MDSILTTIKKLLGIEEDYTQFDTDVILGINTALAVLTQIGVGPSCGFSISDKETTWVDFVGVERPFEAIKSFVHLKVKLLFDPPASSGLLDSINRMISDLEWRILIQFDCDANQLADS